MNTFIVRELQNAQSQREGKEIVCKNLTEAKRTATRSQFFVGTVLTIETPEGVVLSRKQAGVWSNL